MPRSISRSKRRGKYNAHRQELDGITFDSKAEAQRYKALIPLSKSGAIADLQCHPKYKLHVNGIKIGTYSPDFTYVIDGELIVEDVKGRATLTPLYRWKKKHMKAEHQIDVIEMYYNYKNDSFYSK
jgi:hypothetical protein